MAIPIRMVAGPRATLLLPDGRQAAATIAAIDGGGALLATGARPALGSEVTLRHPNAGSCPAVVAGHEAGGLRLRFGHGERAMGFALAILATRGSGRRRDAA